MPRFLWRTVAAGYCLVGEKSPHSACIRGNQGCPIVWTVYEDIQDGSNVNRLVVAKGESNSHIDAVFAVENAV